MTTTEASSLPNNRLTRLLKLIDFLNQPYLPAPSDIASHLGVSLRTLYRDVRTLRDAGYCVSLHPKYWARNRDQLSNIEMPINNRERIAMERLLAKLEQSAQYGSGSDAARGLRKAIALIPSNADEAS